MFHWLYNGPLCSGWEDSSGPFQTATMVDIILSPLATLQRATSPLGPGGSNSEGPRLWGTLQMHIV